MRASGVFGKASRNGFVQLAVMSGSLNSAQESTGKTRSEYSHELVQNHSLQNTASWRGRVFLTTSNDHFALPMSEFELQNQMSFVGVGMWVWPVTISSPIFSGRSPKFQ